MIRFTGIALITADVGRLVAFYREVLQVDFTGDALHAEAQVDGAYLAIYAIGAAREQLAWQIEAGRGGTVTLMFQVEDVDKEYDRLQSFVPTFLTAPKTYPWGARAFHFRDPDGNIVNFVTPPPGASD